MVRENEMHKRLARSRVWKCIMKRRELQVSRRCWLRQSCIRGLGVSPAQARTRKDIQGITWQRDDIIFKDPLNTFFGVERLYGFWQPVESTIMICWTLHGIPRVSWESRGHFDGTLEYKLNKNVKIYEHRVHNIALNAPPRWLEY
ncbi:IQ and ubiquitin-like domain-containing protein [Tanacetum coccineum]